MKAGASPRSSWPLRLALGYLALVCLAWLASRVLAERQWWSTLLLYSPQALYLTPALLTIPLAAWKRHRAALTTNGVAVLLILGPLMGFEPALSPGAAADASRVRLLTYNIHGNHGGLEWLWPELRRYRPDVLVLTEAGGLMAPRHQAAVRQHLPGWSSVLAGDVYISSRWPFAARGEHSLGPAADASRRCMGYARVRAPFGEFWVAGAHFNTAAHGRTLARERWRAPAYLRHTAAVRLEQAGAIVRWANGRDEPVLLAGDFNTPPAGQVYGVLRRRFGDSFAEKGWGWGFTYPARLPLLRIDYVFHSQEWRTVRCEAGPKSGSDHRPVFAELALGS